MWFQENQYPYSSHWRFWKFQDRGELHIVWSKLLQCDISNILNNTNNVGIGDAGREKNHNFCVYFFSIFRDLALKEVCMESKLSWEEFTTFSRYSNQSQVYYTKILFNTCMYSIIYIIIIYCMMYVIIHLSLHLSVHPFIQSKVCIILFVHPSACPSIHWGWYHIHFR